MCHQFLILKVKGIIGHKNYVLFMVYKFQTLEYIGEYSLWLFVYICKIENGQMDWELSNAGKKNYITIMMHLI